MPNTGLPPLRFLIAAIGVLCASSAIASPVGEIEYLGCYARWTPAGLTVGNAGFERSWVVGASGLESAGFHTTTPRKTWMATVEKAPDAPKAGTLDVTAATGRQRVVERESLKLEIQVRGVHEERLTMQLFPETAGVLITRETTLPQPVSSAPTAGPASGIELAPQAKAAAPALGHAGLAVTPEHHRIIQVELADQTDDHDELVFEREWLASAKERPFGTSGNLLVVEDALTREGLVFLTLAPLPHARPVKRPRDFEVDPRRRTIRPVADNYPAITLAYTGGTAGRIAALHHFQRQLRQYDPNRDGQFLSNTWGDRSRDARINETFIHQEIAAGAKLGVDVVQIDDGWQKGRSSNSARGPGGVWNGYWAADPEFWTPDPVRFPRGLAPLVDAARERGMRFGLWYGPDSSNDAANWKRDADRLIELHRGSGIDYIKVDSIKTPTPAAAANQLRLFDTVIEATRGKVVFDLDVTAETRPGYFGLPHTGPIFVENRYTDFRSYWPHHTLRNLWRLSHYVDPLRLRIEFLNNERKADKYGADPLAPVRYEPDTLFAITMFANPLGWFETSNLSEAFVGRVAPLVHRWKAERSRLHGGTIVPVGAAPDGVAWTGFVSRAADGGGYVLLFRELNPAPSYSLPLDGLGGEKPKVTLLGGRGSATVAGGRLEVVVPTALDFIWLRIDAGPAD